MSGNLAFTLPPGFTHELVVVRKKGTEVKFDGVAMVFASAIEGTAYELARLPAADLGDCRDLLDPCQHSLSGAAFGVSWRGMDAVCSYTLTVPPSYVCALPGMRCPL